MASRATARRVAVHVRRLQVGQHRRTRRRPPAARRRCAPRTGSGSTSRIRSRGSPAPRPGEEAGGVGGERVDDARVEYRPRPAAQRVDHHVSVAQTGTSPRRRPRAPPAPHARSLAADAPAATQPPAHHSTISCSARCTPSPSPSRRAVSLATSQLPMSNARPNASPRSASRPSACARGMGRTAGTTLAERLRGVRRVRPRHDAQQRHVVAPRRHRLVRERGAADVQQQRRCKRRRRPPPRPGPSRARAPCRSGMRASRARAASRSRGWRSPTGRRADRRAAVGRARSHSAVDQPGCRPITNHCAALSRAASDAQPALGRWPLSAVEPAEIRRPRGAIRLTTRPRSGHGRRSRPATAARRGRAHRRRPARPGQRRCRRRVHHAPRRLGDDGDGPSCPLGHE